MKNAGTPGATRKGRPGKALRDHSALLAQVIDFLPDPTFAIDRSGTVIIWNRAMEDVTGIRAADMLGKGDHEYSLPLHGLRRPALVDLVLRHDPEVERLYTSITRDGDCLYAETTAFPDRRWAWVKASPIHDAHGAVIGAIETVRDITGRKKAEEALQQSEARYRDIFLNVSDLLYLHDLDGRFIETNLASKKETGYTESDLEHLSIRDILPARHLHRFENYINNVLKNGSDEGFLTIRTKTGEERILEYRNSLITDPDGKPVGVRGSARDITARIKAQKRLRRERDLVSSIVDTSPAFFDAVDSQGITIMMNRAMLQALGYESEDVLGRDYCKTFIPEEDAGTFSRALDDLVSSGRPVVHENRVLRKNGEPLLVLWHSRAVFRGDGSLDFTFGIGIDITEKRKVEEALLERQRQMETLLGNLPGMAYRCRNDRQWTMEFVSDASSTLTGYHPDELVENRFMAYADLIHPDDRDLVRDGVEKALDHRERFQLTYRIRTRQGEERWVWEQGTGVFDASGRLLFLEGFITDISARRKAEEALRQGEERYRLLAENVRDVIWVMDTDLHYVYVSPSVERLRGYTVDEVMRQPVEEALTPESYRQVLGVLSEELRVEREGSIGDPFRSRTIEAELTRKDGSTVWTEITASWLRDADGTASGIIGITRDITERKNAEMALRVSEERFRRMAEVSPQIFWMASPDWQTLIYVSPALEKIFGLHPETVYANPRAWLDIVHPDDREHVLSIFGHDQGMDVEYEFRIVRHDGSVRWIRTRRSPVLDEHGTVTMLVGIAEDITDRKRSDEERTIYEARLARSQKLEAIGTLAGGIAHDFNNILSAIIGYAELVQEDLPGESPVHENLAEVLRAGDRAKDLVRQILTFSRQMETERKPVRVQLIAKEALRLLRSSIPRTIRIVEDIDSSAGPVLADPTQIHQVIMNLCTNAYHAMLSSGGVMTVSVGSTYLDARFTTMHPELAEGPFLRLAVKDTGSGMDGETVKRIFDPFFTTKEKTKGTGLGLATVHGIVSDMGGAVVVTSELGSGSTFEIYLPVTRMQDEDDEEPDLDFEHGSGQSILLVDDEEAILHFTGIMLEQLGYRVTATSSSLEALELFRSSPGTFALIITDQTMPGMTGAELAAEMLSIRPDLPVILMTGYSELIGPEEALARGIEEYLEKPFTKSAMARAVQRCLDMS